MAAATNTFEKPHVQYHGVEPLLIYDSRRAYSVLKELVSLAKEFAVADKSRNPAAARKSAFDNFCSRLSYTEIEPNDLAEEFKAMEKFLTERNVDLNKIFSAFDPKIKGFPCTNPELAVLVDGIGLLDKTLESVKERKNALGPQSRINLDKPYSGKGTIWETASYSDVKLTSARKQGFALMIADMIIANSIRICYGKLSPRVDETSSILKNRDAVETFDDNLAGIAARYGINPGAIELLDLSDKIAEAAADREKMGQAKTDMELHMTQYLHAYLGLDVVLASTIAVARIKNEKYWANSPLQPLPPKLETKKPKAPLEKKSIFGRRPKPALTAKPAEKASKPAKPETAFAGRLKIPPAPKIPKGREILKDHEPPMGVDIRKSKPTVPAAAQQKAFGSLNLDAVLRGTGGGFPALFPINSDVDDSLRGSLATACTGMIIPNSIRIYANSATEFKGSGDVLEHVTEHFLTSSQVKSLESIAKHAHVDPASLKLLDVSQLIGILVKAGSKEERNKAALKITHAISEYLVFYLGIDQLAADNAVSKYADFEHGEIWMSLRRKMPTGIPEKKRAERPEPRITPPVTTAPVPVPAQVSTPAPASTLASQAGAPASPIMAPAPSIPPALQPPAAAPKPTVAEQTTLWGDLDITQEEKDILGSDLAIASLINSLANYARNAGKTQEAMEFTESAAHLEKKFAEEINRKTDARGKERRNITLLDLSSWLRAYAGAASDAEHQKALTDLEDTLARYLSAYGGVSRSTAVAQNCFDKDFFRILKELANPEKEDTRVPGKAEWDEAEELDKQPVEGRGTGEFWYPTNRSASSILNLRPNPQANEDFISLAGACAEVSVIRAVLAATTKAGIDGGAKEQVQKRALEFALQNDSYAKLDAAVGKMKFESAKGKVMLMDLEGCVAELITAKDLDSRHSAIKKIEEIAFLYLMNYMSLPQRGATVKAEGCAQLAASLALNIPQIGIRTEVEAVPVPTKTVDNVAVERHGGQLAAPAEKSEKAKEEEELFKLLGIGDKISVFTSERGGQPLDGDTLRYEVQTRPRGFPSMHYGTSFFGDEGVIDVYRKKKASGNPLAPKEQAVLDFFGHLQEKADSQNSKDRLSYLEKGFGALMQAPK